MSTVLLLFFVSLFVCSEKPSIYIILLLLNSLENAMQKITSTGADEAATILKLEKRVALLESYLVKL